MLILKYYQCKSPSFLL